MFSFFARDIPPVQRQYRDRREAGEELARRLEHYADSVAPQILALPRGGLPVAYPVAIALKAPLHCFHVRKLGLPGHEEYAIGAIASGGIRFVNQDVVRETGISGEQLQEIIAREEEEIGRRERLYASPAPLLVEGRTVILIDDGLATGSTMRAAIMAVKQKSPGKTVVAVPVGSASTCESIAAEVDELICPLMPEPFYAVGEWYADFSQTSDEEVQALLEKAAAAFQQGDGASLHGRSHG